MTSTNWIEIMTGFGNKSMSEIGMVPFLGIMLVSLFSSFFISFLYLHFYQARATGSLIHRAFPLLGMSITAIFVAIQFSLPLSLGLLGALSIVRFRTPIKEPEEIGFIMVVVAASLCCATFNLVFLAIILGCTVLALFCLRFGSSLLSVNQNDGVIIIEINSTLYKKISAEIFKLVDAILQKGRLESVADNQGTTTISYSFKDQSDSSLLQLRKDLEIIDSNIVSNIYFNYNQNL